MKRTINLDVDGVMARFIKGMHKELELLGWNMEKDVLPGYYDDWHIFAHMPKEMRKQALKLCRDSRLFADLELFDHAKEAVDIIRKHCNIRWVTSPFFGSRDFCVDREDWLQKHFSIIENHEPLVLTRDKSMVHADMFLDDRVENILEWVKYGHVNKDGEPAKAFLLRTSFTKNSIGKVAKFENVSVVDSAIELAKMIDAGEV